MKKMLIIEDDPAILFGLKTAFENEDYQVATAEDGGKGHKLASSGDYDIIILDLMLPIKNGFDICRELREGGLKTPLLMLTSKKDEIDKVVGFEIGADDYVTKPYSLRELIARVKALLRRSTPENKTPENYEFDGITVEFKKLDAFRNGCAIGLSVREFEILKFFVEREGQVVSRNDLLDNIWGYDNYPTTRTVDNYILSLRKKIENDTSNPKHIITVHTVGYKFIA